MKIHKYTMRQLLNDNFPEPPPIIKNWIWEQDNIILVGNAKAGKSIWAMQMAFDVSRGNKFLNYYDIPKARTVLYLQAEGKLFSTVKRSRRMDMQIKCNQDNILWFYAPTYPLDMPGAAQKLLEMLGDIKPALVIYDPLYKLVSSGSINEDDVINRLTVNLDIIKSELNCANLITHHTHKVRRDPNGKIIWEGDDAMYGSTFLSAWPDTILLIRKENKKSPKRIISCETQREGEVENEVTTMLHGDPKLPGDALFYELIEDDMNATDIAILTHFSQHPEMTIREIEKAVDMAESTVYKAITRLLEKGLIEHPGKGVYRLKK